MASASLHLVDPELRPALDLLPPIELTRDTLAATRTALAQMVAAAPTRDDLPVRREELAVPGPAGAPAVRVLLYTPAGVTGARSALLYIHGGGYVLGAPEMDDLASRVLAADLGCIVCSVDYRLAPEHPHPAPVEDCYAALRWLHVQAATMGVDPARIGIMGESAGGGLAAALALLARDRGGPAIAFQHLIYPMLDDRTCVDNAPHPCAGEFVWTPAHNRFGWTSLLGEAPGGPGVSPHAAAARATNLGGLPPAFIAVGALDLFVEENLDYARRLMRAGVPVELHVYAGAYHGFRIAAQARTSLAALRDSREALRRAMHG
jgi:triacylglycerol lipase